MQKSYDFNPAILHSLYSSGNMYALTWPAAWLDSQALRMHSKDYRRMLMEKLEQIHAHGDPACYRAYFPRYLLNVKSHTV